MRTTYFILLLIFGLGSGSLFGQGGFENEPNPAVQEKIKTYRVAFFTQKLNLTTEEATTFWPVYNAYDHERMAHRNKTRDLMVKAKNIESLSDAEAGELADAYLEHKKVEYELQRKYHEKFKQVLPVRKVALLYKAEQQFKAEILRMLRRERMENRRNGRN